MLRIEIKYNKNVTEELLEMVGEKRIIESFVSNALEIHKDEIASFLVKNAPCAILPNVVKSKTEEEDVTNYELSIVIVKAGLNKPENMELLNEDTEEDSEPIPEPDTEADRSDDAVCESTDE